MTRYNTNYRGIFIERWSDHDRQYLTINFTEPTAVTGDEVLHQWSDEEVRELEVDGYWNHKKPSELVEYAVNMGLIEVECLSYKQGKGYAMNYLSVALDVASLHSIGGYRCALPFDLNFVRRAKYHYKKYCADPGDCRDDYPMIASLAVATAIIGHCPGWIPNVQMTALAIVDHWPAEENLQGITP